MTAFTTGVGRAELLRRVLVGILCILYQTARQFKPAVCFCFQVVPYYTEPKVHFLHFIVLFYS